MAPQGETEGEAAAEEGGPPAGKPRIKRIREWYRAHPAEVARAAAGAALVAVAAAEFLSVILTRDLVVASVWGMFGFIALATGVYLYRGRFTAWGIAMIVNAFAILLSLATLDLYVLATLIASFVVLYVFRLPFGVGAWKIESAKENERTRAMIEARTRKALGLECPKCGAETLWLADDGSAFCLTCRAGTIELVRRQPS